MPGHYWYDKYSGFWGKKGHRPSQIISANLDLEVYIESNASNGNTEAHINGREITKVELHVLKAIFLYKDIPFLEDELEYIKLLIQSNMDRYIRTLLEGHNHFEEENLNESRNSQSANAHRLTGYDDASDEESIYSFGSRLKAFSDWLLHTMPSASSDVFSASLIQASAPLVEELWSNPSFQETLNRRSELEGLSSVGNYFLKSAVDIFKPDYKPSHTDILHAEGFPSSLSYMDFSFPPPHADEVDIWDPQYYMIRIMGNLEEMGLYYISVKFKELYNSITGQKLYVAEVNCLEQDSVDVALKYARDILKWGKRSRSLPALSVKKKKKNSPVFSSSPTPTRRPPCCELPEPEDTSVTQR
ncbi:hypothetical protein BUALT_Bualt16G0031800 [Buddleja alternifolia]|uniref:Uncharacterized protein n=1 Tax=Buddleja alternifolia TaxID=168488 RepID=A0AAV6WF84_9LAMI|nr:hypothetical protein BUALT_Bualt16G0031800 [Buddleja alternifolia]